MEQAIVGMTSEEMRLPTEVAPVRFVPTWMIVLDSNCPSQNFIDPFPVPIRSNEPKGRDSKVGRLEVHFEKIRHQASHVTSKVRLRDPVATFGVDHELKIFARFLQFVGELHGVCKMDVIIHRPVNQ